MDRASHPTEVEAMRSMSAERKSKGSGPRGTALLPTPTRKSGPPAPLLVEGDIIGGRYQVERCLGGGGMASVYRALHTGLDQPVAIKIVSPQIREVPGVVSRFMREARAATRLRGEHVVRVFDVGTTDNGSPYLVMELLEGRDLAHLLDEGFRPSVHEVIDYALQACEALAEVHGLGIVHRDLKPANLFITRGADGLTCLKLIDFGISRVDSPLSPKDSMTLTNPEVVMGSPRYMPPEQMESAASADSRSDIWGLGAILYEMLTGDAPFDGDSIFDIYAAAVRSPPPAPSAKNPEVPPELDAVILRCLKVNPKERFADVAELAVALAPLGDEYAATRAEAIARVLDAATARARGDNVADDDALGVGLGVGVGLGLAAGGNVGSRSSPSSRIRKRDLTARKRKRKVIFAGAVLAVLVGLVFAARPLAKRMDLGASVSVSGAAAAPPEPTLKQAADPTPTTTTATPGASVSPTMVAPMMSAPPTTVPVASESATPPPAMNTSSRGGASLPLPLPAQPPPSQPQPRAHSNPPPPAPFVPPPAPTPAPQASPSPTYPQISPSDLAPEPAPPPRATPTPRADDRTLFEERK